MNETLDETILDGEREGEDGDAMKRIMWGSFSFISLKPNDKLFEQINI